MAGFALPSATSASDAMQAAIDIGNYAPLKQAELQIKQAAAQEQQLNVQKTLIEMTAAKAQADNDLALKQHQTQRLRDEVPGMQQDVQLANSQVDYFDKSIKSILSDAEFASNRGDKQNAKDLLKQASDLEKEHSKSKLDAMEAQQKLLAFQTGIAGMVKDAASEQQAIQAYKDSGSPVPKDIPVGPWNETHKKWWDNFKQSGTADIEKVKQAEKAENDKRERDQEAEKIGIERGDLAVKRANAATYKELVDFNTRKPTPAELKTQALAEKTAARQDLAIKAATPVLTNIAELNTVFTQNPKLAGGMGWVKRNVGGIVAQVPGGSELIDAVSFGTLNLDAGEIKQADVVADLSEQTKNAIYQGMGGGPLTKTKRDEADKLMSAVAASKTADQAQTNLQRLANFVVDQVYRTSGAAIPYINLQAESEKGDMSEILSGIKTGTPDTTPIAKKEQKVAKTPAGAMSPEQQSFMSTGNYIKDQFGNITLPDGSVWKAKK